MTLARHGTPQHRCRSCRTAVQAPPGHRRGDLLCPWCDREQREAQRPQRTTEAWGLGAHLWPTTAQSLSGDDIERRVASTLARAARAAVPPAAGRSETRSAGDEDLAESVRCFARRIRSGTASMGSRFRHEGVDISDEVRAYAAAHGALETRTADPLTRVFDFQGRVH